ncbi:MAG: DUF2934 domain-containing protein [Acidobacteria bacterium]|nr:DUF2934 domain-containing protein [Acidobacteriota bacterium]
MPKESRKEPQEGTQITPRRRKPEPGRDRAQDRAGAATPPGAGLPEFGGPAAPPPGMEADWELSREEIGRRAYEIYERRGSDHGRDFDDWLEAEQQLRRERSRKSQ